MSHKTSQGGDDWNKIPGTSNQTGNSAPKFPWSTSKIGRTARIAALLCAYRLGYTDDRMASLHELPPMNDLFKLFNTLFPWFEEHYNQLRKAKAIAKNYSGPLEPYGPEDVHNRVRYCFAKPGRKGHDPKARLYGISVEHPLSTAQNHPAGRHGVFARCSTTIERRITMGESISKEEAEFWGR